MISTVKFKEEVQVIGMPQKRFSEGVEPIFSESALERFKGVPGDACEPRVFEVVSTDGKFRYSYKEGSKYFVSHRGDIYWGFTNLVSLEWIKMARTRWLDRGVEGTSAP